MTQNHSRLRELFIATCDLPKSAQIQWMDNHCSDDPELRRELERLLQNDLAGGLFAAGDTAAEIQVLFDTQIGTEMPAHVGKYRVKKILGQGGMGDVYLAEQQNPRRDVAVKVIRSGMANQDILKRFELEAAVLGRLQHAGIANIYEANVFVDSVTGQERPFLAMEYIEGASLLEFIEARDPDQRDRLQLFVKICEAINHAHQRGVIHRDLKPANVMVKHDGQPSILDFGVARATGGDAGNTAQQTQVGQLIGTLPYMSPEQVKGNALDADTRSDVYALGLIAYELLSGKLPYAVDRTDYLKSVRIISEQQPITLATIRPECRGDLNTIVLKALEKEPDRRYQSAKDLADDVQRYLDDKPIEARRIGWTERSWRWCRRNKSLAALAATVVALVLSVAVIASVSVVQLKAAAERVAAESQVSNRRLFDSYLDQAKLRQLSHRPGQRLEAIKALEGASSLFPTLNWEPGEQESNLVLLRTDLIGSLSTYDLSEVKSWERPAGSDKFQFDSNYQRYAISDAVGTIQIRSVESRRAVLELAGDGDPAWKLMFSPGGRYIGAFFHDEAMTIPIMRVWNTTTGELVIQDRGKHINEYAFSHDDRKFAYCNADGNILVLSMDRLQDSPIVLEPKFRHNGLYFRPDGAELAGTEKYNTVQIEIWNLKDKSSRLIATESCVYSIGWNPNSDQIAMGCEDGVIRIWDVDNYGKSPVRLTGHTAQVVEVEFNDTGEFLVSRAWDSTQRFWDVRRKTEVFRTDSSDIRFNKMGTRQNQLGFLRKERFGFWEFGFDSSFTDFSSESASIGIDYHPMAALIASATNNGIELWDVNTHAVLAEFPIGETISAIFSPDGSRMYSSGNGGVRQWPLEFDSGESGQVRIGTPTILLTGDDLVEAFQVKERAAGLTEQSNESDYEHIYKMESISLDRTGRWLSIDCGGVFALVMDLQENNQLHALGGTKDAFQNSLNQAEISPDGKWVVTTTWNGNGVWVWGTENGHAAPWLGKGGRRTSSPRTKLIEGDVSAATAFSPNGESLAIATKEEVTIWEVGTWQVQQRFEREVNDWVGTAAFSPDGRYLVTAYDRRALQLRDIQSGERLAIFRVRSGDHINDAKFSPDGSTLAAISRNSIVAWDLVAIQERLNAMGIAWAD